MLPDFSHRCGEIHGSGYREFCVIIAEFGPIEPCSTIIAGGEQCRPFCCDCATAQHCAAQRKSITYNVFIEVLEGTYVAHYPCINRHLCGWLLEAWRDS